MPAFCLILAVVLGQSQPPSGDGRGASAEPARANAVGLVAGSPQWVGVSYERAFSRHLSIGLHVGTLGFFSSLGARLVIGSTDAGFRPRLGLGLALISALYQEDSDDPDGMAAYAWPAVGLTWRNRRLLVAADAGWLFTGNRDAGLGQAGFPAASLSLLFRL
jgi:hypothetical protein